MGYCAVKMQDSCMMRYCVIQTIKNLRGNMTSTATTTPSTSIHTPFQLTPAFTSMVIISKRQSQTDWERGREREREQERKRWKGIITNKWGFLCVLVHLYLYSLEVAFILRKDQHFLSTGKRYEIMTNLSISLLGKLQHQILSNETTAQTNLF